MKIRRLTITNFKGIEHLTAEVGKLTVVAGQNGAGKSSVLDALRCVFDGGHNPALIRQDSDKALIALEIDNGVTITKTITRKSSELSVTDPEGREVKSPKRFVEGLAEGFGFDPLGLITTEPKKRRDYLLRVLPLEFPREKVAKALGDLPLHTALNFDSRGEALALDDLDACRKAIYDERTAQNRIGKQAEGNEQELHRALADIPKEMDSTDWRAAERAAAQKIAEVDRLLAEEKDRIRAAMEREIEVIRERARQETEAAVAEHKPVRDDLVARREKARAMVEEGVRLQALRDQHAKAMEKTREHNLLSMKLEAALQKLDALREDALKALPIAGVEFKNGELHVDGVPFDQLNTARQFELCFVLARLSAGDLGLMVCDRAESLDQQTWDEFCAAVANEDGVQAVVARVSEGDLALQVQ